MNTDEIYDIKSLEMVQTSSEENRGEHGRIKAGVTVDKRGPITIQPSFFFLFISLRRELPLFPLRCVPWTREVSPRAAAPHRDSPPIGLPTTFFPLAVESGSGASRWADAYASLQRIVSKRYGLMPTNYVYKFQINPIQRLSAIHSFSRDEWRDIGVLRTK